MAQTGVAPNLGREQAFDALGKTWKLPRQDLLRWAEVWDWLKTRLPDPYAGLEKLIDKMPPDMAREEIQKARERELEMATLDSPEVQKLLDTVEGRVERFYLLLRVNHPDVTRETAQEILMEIGRQEMERLEQTAAGEPPPVGNASAPAVSA